MPTIKTTTRKEQSEPRGRVEINEALCKGCGYCIEFCPRDVLAWSGSFNGKGYHPPRIAAPERCTGCGLCGMYCPDFAIFGYRTNSPGTSQREQGE